MLVNLQTAVQRGQGRLYHRYGSPLEEKIIHRKAALLTLKKHDHRRGLTKGSGASQAGAAQDRQ